MGRAIDMTDKRFGRVTVIRRSLGQTTDGRPLWLSLCDCGTLFEANGKSLRRGLTRSCGCLARETTSARNTTHGQGGMNHRTPTYNSWRAMLNRCLNPKAQNWRYYGAIGVAVYEAWLSFEKFFADMGERPANHVLARRGDAGDYEPGNVEWKLQADNLRERHVV